jgi:ParB/RepB/Spo0J family partition protein
MKKTRKKSLRTLWLSKIHRRPDQPRQDFDEARLQELAQSLREEGNIEPPTVEPHPKLKGHWMIVAGERRWRAMLINGTRREQFLVRDGGGDPFMESVVENMHRENLNPIEEAITLKRLRDEYKLTYAEIERKTGFTPASVINKIELLELPEEIQDMVRQGRLPQVGALNLNQFKGERGDMIRMAYDLMAGKKPIELLLSTQRTSAQSDAVTKAKLPKTAHNMFRRILSLEWAFRTFPLITELFQQQSPRELERIWEKVPADTRAEIAQRLSRIIVAVYQLADALKITLTVPAEVPVVTFMPVARAASNGNGASHEPDVDPTTNFALLEKVLSHLLYEDAEPLINMSGSRLQQEFRLGEGLEPIVHQAFSLVRLRWNATPQSKNDAENDFIMFVSNVRADFNVDDFPSLMRLVKKSNSCGDPIAVHL